MLSRLLAEQMLGKMPVSRWKKVRKVKSKEVRSL